MGSLKDVIVANHHTGPIQFPRMYHPNVDGDPAKMNLKFDAKTIQPGGCVLVSSLEWAERKKVPAIAYYLDHGHLAVVRREGQVDQDIDYTTQLEVPEHLQADQDGATTAESKIGDGVQVKASLRRTAKGTATV